MSSPAQSKAQQNRDFRQEVTDSIVRMLEQGVAPWQKPWEGAGIPQNPTTGRAYRGGNALHLMATAIRREFDDPRWLTYRQAAAQGWQVRQGEKGTQIEFWQAKAQAERSGDRNDAVADKDQPRLVRRVYTVFNAKQIDGIPAYAPRQHSAFETAQAGERILANSGATIVHDQADQAFYRPVTDSIHLPPRNAFKDAPGYYGTALHELAHWTGHQSRLNRPTLTDSYRFGDVNYAREELRAELASVFLAAERGIPHDPASHAAYVGSWIKSLREDKNEIFRAAHDASAAADYLLTLEREKTRAEALEAAPDSIEPEQQRTELDDETRQLNEDEQAVALGAERDSTRETVRYEPGSEAVLVHGKEPGDDRRTPAGVAPNSAAVPSRDDLQKSFAAAKALAAQALGENAKTRTALTASGNYRGEIIGDTDLHLVQRLSPVSAVAHMKHLLEPQPRLGENVVVAYSNQKGTVRDAHQRGKGRGMGR
jgi:antirestriction protein ArdC